MSKNFLLIIAGVCLGIFVTACVASSRMKVVDPVNETEFASALEILKPTMLANRILDHNGVWHSKIFFLQARFGKLEDAGQILLSRLSPSFRLPPVLMEENRLAFQTIFTPETRIVTDAHSFTAFPGSDQIYVSLLATLDWDEDGKEDWLVLCRSFPTTLSGMVREYYLIIKDFTPWILEPEVIGIRDCQNSVCSVYLAQDLSEFIAGNNTLDLMPGDITITMPPEQGNKVTVETGTHDEFRLSE